MTTRLAAHAVPAVGANSFAWHFAGKHLRSGDEHQRLTLQGDLTPLRSSHGPRGRIARGSANEFAPTKAAAAVWRLIERPKLPGDPTRTPILGPLP